MNSMGAKVRRSKVRRSFRPSYHLVSDVLNSKKDGQSKILTRTLDGRNRVLRPNHNNSMRVECCRIERTARTCFRPSYVSKLVSAHPNS